MEPLSTESVNIEIMSKGKDDTSNSKGDYPHTNYFCFVLNEEKRVEKFGRQGDIKTSRNRKNVSER